MSVTGRSNEHQISSAAVLPMLIFQLATFNKSLNFVICEIVIVLIIEFKQFVSKL